MTAMKSLMTSKSFKLNCSNLKMISELITSNLTFNKWSHAPVQLQSTHRCFQPMTTWAERWCKNPWRVLTALFIGAFKRNNPKWRVVQKCYPKECNGSWKAFPSTTTKKYYEGFWFTKWPPQFFFSSFSFPFLDNDKIISSVTRIWAFLIFCFTL